MTNLKKSSPVGINPSVEEIEDTEDTKEYATATNKKSKLLVSPSHLSKLGLWKGNRYFK